MRIKRAFYLTLISAAAMAQPKSNVFFAPHPGAAQVSSSPAQFTLSNGVLRASWTIGDGHLRGSQFVDLISKQTITAQSSPFTLLLGDGRVLNAAAMKIKGVSVETPSPDITSSRLADRFGGKAVRVEMDDVASGLQLVWRAILRDESNYIRQEIELTVKDNDLPITEIRLIDWSLPDAHVIGTVRGSPVISERIFVGFEHPLSTCAVALGRALCNLERELPLKAGHSVAYSSVIGVTAPNQLRRGFLYYLERERAHPYRAFLHYNSWYDLGYFSQYDEAGALDRINAFGTELTKKRGVKLSSFLFDDGWDDPSTLWHFNSGFPEGFTRVRSAAEQYGAEPGVWMSPWGGYGKPKQQRLASAKSAGYEIVDNGLALSGPKYYELFHGTCLKMIREFGVNQFKFDGTGNANRVFPGSQFDSDFDAAINLINDLRKERPNIYINLTTGTYPSPFWLRYADSIWRDGEDHSFLGVGSKRQQWITYRDAMTYEHVVMAGPIYPLNSLMLHGLIYARFAKDLQTDPGDDFKSEVRDYFGTGTQLQEMYITPSLLSQADWDNLAEAANWSRAQADALVDTHWIGGDPARLEIYGWAAWSPQEATLVLRNPGDKPQTIAIDIGKAFEIPAGMNTAYTAHSPWKEDAAAQPVHLEAGKLHEFALKPFEVLTLDAKPVPIPPSTTSHKQVRHQ